MHAPRIKVVDAFFPELEPTKKQGKVQLLVLVNTILEADPKLKNPWDDFPKLGGIK